MLACACQDARDVRSDSEQDSSSPETNDENVVRGDGFAHIDAKEKPSVATAVATRRPVAVTTTAASAAESDPDPM